MATFERKAARYLAVVRIGLEELKDPGLEVTKAWLPVETQVISREIAKQLGQPALKGFYITRVYPGTTAEKAGLKPGDFITAVDGAKLSASDSEYEDELSSLIRQYDIGKTVELTVLRDKAELKIPVELARSPRLQREMKKYRNDDFEFTARDVSFFDTRRGAMEQRPARRAGGERQVRQLGGAGLAHRRRPDPGSERPAGGHRGRAAARDGADRRLQREGGGDQSAARHPHLLPGNRTELEELTLTKESLCVANPHCLLFALALAAGRRGRSQPRR